MKTYDRIVALLENLKLYSTGATAMFLAEERAKRTVFNDADTVSRLVADNMGLARAIAHRWVPKIRSAEPDDIMSHAMSALVRSAERYDQGKTEHGFGAYASKVIDNELCRLCNNTIAYSAPLTSMDAPVGDEDGMTRHDVLGDITDTPVQDRAERSDIIDMVRNAISTVKNEHDRRALELTMFQNMTTRQAAKVMGTSPTAVVHAYMRAMDQIKTYLRGRGITADNFMPGSVRM